MLKEIDTSYLIVIDKEGRQLVAYYDSRGKLDNCSSLMSNLVELGGYKCISDVFDKTPEELNDELVAIFKKEWNRFYLIKSYPIDDTGLEIDQLKTILKENVEGYLMNNHLCDQWRKRQAFRNTYT